MYESASQFGALPGMMAGEGSTAHAAMDESYAALAIRHTDAQQQIGADVPDSTRLCFA